jgi:hypothetical protein
MKKVIKSFGIGAAVLMLCLAFIPCVYGAVSTTNENQIIDDMKLNEGALSAEDLKVFQTYVENNAEEFKDIVSYMSEYLEKYGALDGLELPVELEELLSDMINSFLNEQSSGGDLPPCLEPKKTKWWQIAIIVLIIIILII